MASARASLPSRLRQFLSTEGAIGPSIKLDSEQSGRQMDDSNANILPAKEKKKNKVKGQKNQVSEGLKPKLNHTLSKSQKRKLKKIEEEKEKAFLLTRSIEALEKYRINDNVLSLLWSSRNLGQVETVHQKRQREVLFTKAGLELPSSCQPSKRRNNGNHIFEVDHDSDGTQSSSEFCIYRSAEGEIDAIDNNTASLPQLSSEQAPVLQKQVALGGNNDVPFEHMETKEVGLCTSECLQLSLSNTNSDEASTRKSTVNFIVSEKFDDNSLGNLESPSSERPSTEPIAVDASGVNVDGNHKASLCSTIVLQNSARERTLSPPTVVHVSRSEHIENQRKGLPIIMMEQEIMEKVHENMSLIICGETGCGKTTQVPQFLYEAGFGSKSCNARGGMIGVTQPRRVAVLSTAKRVAVELGLRLGKEIGFQVRHDRMIGADCSIKFMTDGILLREVQNDFLLKRYSTLILDEAHERSLNTDILIGMLSRVIQLRQKEYETQQQMIVSGKKLEPENRIYPLKLILMSATLRVEDFTTNTRIFNVPPPVINVPTRQYEVTIHFSKSTDIIDYIGRAYKKVMSIHKRLPPGGILVFVTGQHEVEYLCRKLRKASCEIVRRVSEADRITSSVSRNNSAEPLDMDIVEAFDLQKNSCHDITERFNSYDEVDEDLSESESELSTNSEDESDLEVPGYDEDSLSRQESEGNLENVLKEEGNLASLKAAFEALAGKGTKKIESQGEEVLSAKPEGRSITHESVVGHPTIVKKCSSAGPMRVLPLYAMLPASAQLRVFEEVKEGERLVVVATNVAETSLTIPGIKYVVDTGREKSKRYNSSNGMETYEVQWISKASASQRAGRAGRTGPGHCYRLYSSAVFSNILPDFSDAEISKVPVDGVVLLMKSMHIDKVINFPFPTPPERAAIVEAESCLKVLGALDVNGRLTPLGKAMAHYPMSPRHSRALLTVILLMQNQKNYPRANLVLAYAVAAAAALSLSNPFEMHFERSNSDKDDLKTDENTGLAGKGKSLDKEEKRRKKELKENFKISRARFSNPTSDSLTTAFALQCFELSGNPTKFCSDNALHLKTMEEMSKLRNQLLRLVFNSKFTDSPQEFVWPHGGENDVMSAWNVSTDMNPLLKNEEEILGQAICAGWADRVAKRIKPVFSEGERKVNATHYQACLVKETIYLHRWSSLSKTAPEFLVYTELRHTKRPYVHGATVVKPDWLIKYAHSMCTFSSPHSDPKPFYDPVTDRVLCWVTPTFGPHLWELPLHPVPIRDDANRVAVFAYSLLIGQVLPCLKSVQNFMAASPASILKPEASGSKRVGNLVNKLKRRRTIDCCARLREAWKDDPSELYLEIRDWFQQGFHKNFEELWGKMHYEILLDPKDRYPRKGKKAKERM